MSFEEHIEKRFEENLTLTSEALFLNSHDRKAWDVARKWTLDDLGREVTIYIENKWWILQEGLNKEFYE